MAFEGISLTVVACLVLSNETTVPTSWYLDNLSVEEPGRSSVPYSGVDNLLVGVAWLAE